MTGAGHWRFDVLGPLRLNHGGVEMPLAGARARTLLALLLAHRGRPLSRDQMIDELWEGQPPATGAQAVHVYLSKVRAAVDDLLLKRDGGYLLDPARMELDVDVFSALLTRARANPDAAGAALNEALGLWRGRPFAELPAITPLTRWADALTEQHLQARVLRIETNLDRAPSHELVHELNTLIREHPYDERVASGLMLALYRLGREAEALDAYQHLRRTMATDLGLEPGEPLRRLEARILAQDPTLLLGINRPVTARPSRGPGAAVVSIPTPTTRLIGREQDLSILQGLCGNPGCRLITLTGQGGVGKTRLALEQARRWADAFADGAFFISLADIAEADRAAGHIASTLARSMEGIEPTEQNLTTFLSDRETLLVLDNFEHVLNAVPLVAEILAAGPAVRILVTSRIPLHLRGEHLVEIDSLSVSPPDAVPSGSALELFVHGAAMAGARLVLSEDARQQIATICRALDGLPLAIELASARMRLVTLDQIEAQLTHPLTIGANALVDVPTRQSTLTATIRWSYELLSPEAQRALRAAGCFQSSFTADALAAVAGMPIEPVLTDLLDAHVIKRAAEPDRFRLLELVRAFSRELLEADPAEGEALLKAHQNYFIERYALAGSIRAHGNPGAIARELVPDQDNLLAAAYHAIDAEDADGALKLILILQPLWNLSFSSQDASSVTETALTGCTFAAEDELLLYRNASSFTMHDPEQCRRWRLRYAARAEELDASYEVTDALMLLIAAALERRDVADALVLRDRLLGTPEPAPDKPRARSARALYLSQCAYVTGDFAGATALVEQMYEPVREGPHEYSLGLAHMWAVIARSASDGTIPAAALLDQLRSARALELVDLTVVAGWNAARYVAALDPEFSADLLADADRIAEEFGVVLWPEDELRRETLRLLSVTDPASLRARAAGRSAMELLDTAIAWLEERDPGESVPRAMLTAAPAIDDVRS